jgi:hypothetical protein
MKTHHSVQKCASREVLRSTVAMEFNKVVWVFFFFKELTQLCIDKVQQTTIKLF